MTKELANRQCVPCRGGVVPLICCEHTQPFIDLLP
jgi:hypothetical protein